jgi:hypothetical protein
VFAKWSFRGFILILAILLSVNSSEAWPHRRSGKKAHVRFLAASTLIRGTWGPNQDIYLAELRFGKKDAPALVRLVDVYPNESPSLSYTTLTDSSGVSLRVRRNRECDISFGSMPLRTAPGDPMGVLLEKLSYQPKLDPMPDPESILPCYRIARR